MKTTYFSLLNLISTVRAPLIRLIKPGKTYTLGNLRPISKKYSFDRGKPIDRYYLEKFLHQNKRHIKGICLEIGNNSYTRKFGGKRVTRSDVLDINNKNFFANIHGDLSNLPQIKDNTYDCLVITQTLGMIPEYTKAIKECYRILKPGKYILFTGSSIGPLWELSGSYWKFTPAGTKYLFAKAFKNKNIKLKTYGNLPAAQAFLAGLSVQDVDKKSLDHLDPHFPVLITAKAKK